MIILIFLPLFINLSPNLDWIVTRLLEITDLIRFTKRFLLVLTYNKPIYNFALALFINISYKLLTYYFFISNSTMPTLLTLNASMQVIVYSHPFNAECFNIDCSMVSTWFAL